MEWTLPSFFFKRCYRQTDKIVEKMSLKSGHLLSSAFMAQKLVQGCLCRLFTLTCLEIGPCMQIVSMNWARFNITNVNLGTTTKQDEKFFPRHQSHIFPQVARNSREMLLEHILVLFNCRYRTLKQFFTAILIMILRKSKKKFSMESELDTFQSEVQLLSRTQSQNSNPIKKR